MRAKESHLPIIVEPKKQAEAAVIWLHGLGADATDFVGVVPQLNLPESLNVRFIFPNAPIRAVTINGGMHMRAWYDIYSLGNLAREDMLGIKATSETLAELINIENNKGIPSDKIILAGFSQGGASVLYAGLRYSQKLAGIMALSCYLPLMPQLKIEMNPAALKTPILLLHGNQDNVIPVQLGLMTKQVLQENNLDVTWKTYPMAHMVCLPELHDIGQWIAQRFEHSTM